MEKVKNPYMHIILSTNTESEPEEVNGQIMVAGLGKPKKKVVKKTKQLSTHLKKYENLFNTEKSLKEHIEAQNYDRVFEDFKKFEKDIDNMKHIIDVEGTPMVYLRVLNQLDEFVQKIYENEEAKEAQKSTKVLKQKLEKSLDSFRTEIDAAKNSGDLFKIEEEAQEEILITDDGK